MTILKALTVRQPYAYAIVSGRKDVENRSWPTSHRGWLVIHAALSVDDDAIVALRAMAHDVPGALVLGKIIGVVRVHDVVANSTSRWAQSGAWHWLLRDARALTTPLPARGARGLWDVPADHIDVLSSLIA